MYLLIETDIKEIIFKHYTQVTDADIRQAATISILNDSLEKVSQKAVHDTVHNAVHTYAETTGSILQDKSMGIDVSSTNCRTLHKKKPSIASHCK